MLYFDNLCNYFLSKKVAVIPPISFSIHLRFASSLSWRSVDGNDEACRSCDLSHRAEEPPSTEPPTTTTTTTSTKAWSHAATQASLVQQRHEHLPATYYRVRPGMPKRHNRPSLTHQSPAGLMKRGAKYEAGECSSSCM